MILLLFNCYNIIEYNASVLPDHKVIFNEHNSFDVVFQVFVSKQLVYNVFH